MIELADQILKRFVSGEVLGRAELGLSANDDSVGRVLRRKTEEGSLVQIGYGLYARAARSPFTGKAGPVVGIRRLASEALCRLGKKVETSSLGSAMFQWSPPKKRLSLG